jgi:hypothetical protein
MTLNDEVTRDERLLFAIWAGALVLNPEAQ